MRRPLPVPTGMEEKWATVSGGKLRYLVGGNGQPLVLVHGIAASPFSFRLNCPELMSHFRIYLVDLLSPACLSCEDGIGASLADIATRIREFLDQAGLEQTDVLASSHGGAVVMELAATVPERFRKMVLVSPANPFARRYHGILNFYQSPVGRMFVRIATHLPGRAWNYGIGRMYADRGRMPRGTGIGYALPLRTPGASKYILSCVRSFVEDIEELGPKLSILSSIPTLLVWGDRDPVVEIESAYPLQKALNAKMAVMKGVGHLPYEESPAEFNRIAIEYLTS